MSETDKTRHLLSFLSSCTEQLTPGLYVISTPIGHFGDITLRALETLKNVAVIFCEDTRVTQKLLNHYGLRTPLKRYDDHKGHLVRPQILSLIREGKAVGLVSDAGTPLLSDPGFKLVKEVAAAELSAIPIPGATAITTALSVAGVPPYPFVFQGFLPTTTKARRQKLADIGAWPVTHVFFERASRLTGTLEDVTQAFGDCQVAVGRELTKKFEEVIRGSVQEVLEKLSQKTVLKGEIVLMLHREAPAQVGDEDLAKFLQKMMETLSLKEAVAEAQKQLNVERRRAYQLALTLK